MEWRGFTETLICFVLLISYRTAYIIKQIFCTCTRYFKPFFILKSKSSKNIRERLLEKEILNTKRLLISLRFRTEEFYVGRGRHHQESAEPDNSVSISVIRDLIHVQSTKRRITIVDNLEKKISLSSL